MIPELLPIAFPVQHFGISRRRYHESKGVSNATSAILRKGSLTWDTRCVGATFEGLALRCRAIDPCIL